MNGFVFEGHPQKGAPNLWKHASIWAYSWFLYVIHMYIYIYIYIYVYIYIYTYRHLEPRQGRPHRIVVTVGSETDLLVVSTAMQGLKCAATCAVLLRGATAHALIYGKCWPKSLAWQNAGARIYRNVSHARGSSTFCFVFLGSWRADVLHSCLDHLGV